MKTLTIIPALVLAGLAIYGASAASSQAQDATLVCSPHQICDL